VVVVLLYSFTGGSEEKLRQQCWPVAVELVQGSLNMNFHLITVLTIFKLQ
jgi:hypothetical protein